MRGAGADWARIADDANGFTILFVMPACGSRKERFLCESYSLLGGGKRQKQFVPAGAGLHKKLTLRSDDFRIARQPLNDDAALLISECLAIFSARRGVKMTPTLRDSFP